MFYTERNPCFIHTTVLLIGPTFPVVFSHTFRSCLMSWFWILMFSFHVLMLCTSLLSFQLQYACTFSKSILRYIHKVVKVTQLQLDSHWADVCEIWYWDVCIKIYQKSHLAKIGQKQPSFYMKTYINLYIVEYFVKREKFQTNRYT